MTDDRLADIIDRAKRKDPEAFDALIDAYGKRVYGYIYRLTGSRHEAEELFQEVFLRLVRVIDRYEHAGRFEGWLFRIATNLVRDRIRRIQREPEVFSFEPSDSSLDSDDNASWTPMGDPTTDSPDQPMMLREDVDAVQQALAELPEAEREVVMLRYFSELSFAEIAEAMGTPLGTALARAHRGLAKLRERMTEQ